LTGAIYGSGDIPLRWINALANEANGSENGENRLAMRLIDLAHIAYAERTGTKNPAFQFRNYPIKKFFEKIKKGLDIMGI
jgi:hypothetical protein